MKAHPTAICIVTLTFLFSVPAVFAQGAGEGSAAKNAQKKLQVQQLTILRDDGAAIPLIAEVARTDEERARGLMFRTKLNDGEGMLFVYERDIIMHFWMKNTLLPLSIAFIAKDGAILEIHEMEAGSTRDVSSSRSARYALEAPRGWFSRNGIEAGKARVDFITP